MNSRKYWETREQKAQQRYESQDYEYQLEMRDIYERTRANVQREIDGFYARYAKNEGITMAEAKKRASKIDMDEYERKAAKYVKEKNFSERANEEMRLYNMVMKVNRLEMLKARIGLELVSGFQELDDFGRDKATLRAADEFKRQAGILGDAVGNVEKAAEAVASSSFYNATFSERIWMHQDLLKNDLQKVLSNALIQGKNSRDIAGDIKSKFDVSSRDAYRLVRTELARCQIGAQQESLTRSGVEEYEFIGGQAKQCELCASMDGKRFKVKDMVIGENAPPLHPYCRCSIAASVELTEKERGAMRSYFSSESYKLNYKLRSNKKLSVEDKAWIANLDSAIIKMPKYKGTVYRSLSSDMIDNIGEFNERHTPGQKIQYDAFTSSSTSIYDENMDIQMIINSKNGADFRKYNKNEKEILFKRGTEFRITKTEGNTIWMEEM